MQILVSLLKDQVFWYNITKLVIKEKKQGIRWRVVCTTCSTRNHSSISSSSTSLFQPQAGIGDRLLSFNYHLFLWPHNQIPRCNIMCVLYCLCTQKIHPELLRKHRQQRSIFALWLCSFFLLYSVTYSHNKWGARSFWTFFCKTTPQYIPLESHITSKGLE